MPITAALFVSCGLCVSTVAIASPPAPSEPTLRAPSLRAAAAEPGSLKGLTQPKLNTHTTLSTNKRRALLANPHPLAPVHASLLDHQFQSSAAADTFTGEALVQDLGGAYFLDDSESSSFLLDGQPEVGGTSLVNAGTFMFMSDAVTDLASATLVQVEMGAYDASGAPTLWVDSSAAGLGLDTWRFDVGTALGGTDPISLESAFTVIDSGAVVFSSDGTIIGEFTLALDDSTSTTLAGVATIGLGGADIAGFDVFAIQLWWEVELDSTSEPEPNDCVGDLNGDGFVDIGDINAFVESFLAGCP